MSHKFKGGAGREAVLWTPYARVLLIGPDGTSPKIRKEALGGTLTVLLHGNEGGKLRARSRLDPGRGWEREGPDRYANRISSENKLSRDFRDACIASGVGELAGAAANPLAPPWIKQSVSRMLKQAEGKREPRKRQRQKFTPPPGSVVLAWSARGRLIINAVDGLAPRYKILARDRVLTVVTSGTGGAFEKVREGLSGHRGWRPDEGQTRFRNAITTDHRLNRDLTDACLALGFGEIGFSANPDAPPWVHQIIGEIGKQPEPDARPAAIPAEGASV